MSRRILHTMLRVGDLHKSIDFYVNAIGMSLVRMFDNPEQGYTLAFLGFAAEESSTVIELTYNYGIDAYARSPSFGHIAIGVDDCISACERVKACEGRVTREPGVLKGGTEVIAFVQDPDENLIEFIERPLSWFPGQAGD